MKLEKIEPLDSPNYLRLIFDDGKRLKAPAFKVVELGLMLAGGLSIWLYIIAAIILPETNAF